MTSIQTQVSYLVSEDPHILNEDLYKVLNATNKKEKATIRQSKHRALKNHTKKIFHPKKKRVIPNTPTCFDDIVKNGYPSYKSLFSWQWDLFKVIEATDNILIVVPRDHGKSIFLTYYIEYLLHVKQMDILLLGWTDRVKQMAMYVYSYFLRNDALNDESIMRATTNHFMTNEGIRFDCYGLKEKAILGFHPEDFEGKNGMALIIDDPIDESFEMYPSKERDVEARWESTISNINPTKLIISGTRKFEDDFLDYIAKAYTDITVFHRTPYNEDGSLLCPERWTLEKLIKKRAEIGEYRFSSEYMGNPVPLTGGVWLESDIHYASIIKKWKEYDQCIISVDAAWTTEETSDYTSIEILLREKGTRQYTVFEDITEKMDFDQILSRIELLYKDLRKQLTWINIKVAIESNGGGILLINLAIARQYSFSNYILEVKHSRAKQERVMVLEMPIKNGSILFMDNLKKSQLINQILTYPRCKNDDAIDALAMAFTELEQISNREFKVYRAKWY